MNSNIYTFINNNELISDELLGSLFGFGRDFLYFLTNAADTFAIKVRYT